MVEAMLFYTSDISSVFSFGCHYYFSYICLEFLCSHIECGHSSTFQKCWLCNDWHIQFIIIDTFSLFSVLYLFFMNLFLSSIMKLFTLLHLPHAFQSDVGYPSVGPLALGWCHMYLSFAFGGVINLSSCCYCHINSLNYCLHYRLCHALFMCHFFVFFFPVLVLVWYCFVWACLVSPFCIFKSALHKIFLTSDTM